MEGVVRAVVVRAVVVREGVEGEGEVIATPLGVAGVAAQLEVEKAAEQVAPHCFPAAAAVDAARC